jgi:hypothetical protein
LNEENVLTFKMIHTSHSSEDSGDYEDEIAAAAVDKEDNGVCKVKTTLTITVALLGGGGHGQLLWTSKLFSKCSSYSVCTFIAHRDLKPRPSGL